VFWFGSFLVLVPVSFVLIFLALVNLVSNLYLFSVLRFPYVFKL